MSGPDADILQRTEQLRALARGILGDAHEAEDVVQDAWVAALRRPDRPANPIAWMFGATRNLVFRSVRSKARVRRRERLAARPEREPSTAELAAESETLRRLAAAVAELDDPYREAVVLRYYHGLAPREIAKRRGEPVATVKTRLRRALALLRARLDREHGSGLWIAPLALLAQGLEKGGGVALAAKVKVTLATAAVVALLLLWSVQSNRSGSDVPRNALETARVETAPRSNVPTPPDDRPEALSAPIARIEVVGPAGEPVEGAEVRVRALGEFVGGLEARTGAEGRAEVPIDVKGAYQVSVTADGFVRRGAFRHFPGDARIQLRRGCRVTLVPKPWPHPAWGEFRWELAGEIHASVTIEIDAAKIDAGVWPEGGLSIYHSPLGGGVNRRVVLALPAGGEVVHELALPQRQSAPFIVEDAATGALVHDWTAWRNSLGSPTAPRELAREQDSPFGVYRIFASRGFVLLRASGYAREISFIDPNTKEPRRVALRRGASLEFAFPEGGRPQSVAVYYDSPKDSTYAFSVSHRTGPEPAGEEFNLSRLGWDKLSEPRRIARIEGREEWRIDDLPPDSRLFVLARNEQGHFTGTRAETGAAGSKASVELAWPRMERHVLTVRGADGAPHAGVEVRFADGDKRLGGVLTDSHGRVRLAGVRVGHNYTITTHHRGAVQRHELADELILNEREPQIRRVLVLDASGDPVSNVRVQYGVANEAGTFAVTDADGIARGDLAGAKLAFVALQWEPGVNSGVQSNPPAHEDPIVFRGDPTGTVVHADVTADGVVDLVLRVGDREWNQRVHVHGRGRARVPGSHPPGAYVLQATLEGRTIEVPFVARPGEPSIVPVRFD